MKRALSDSLQELLENAQTFPGLKALLLFFICKLVGSFSSQHETAEGRTQAIRIKRYSESVFLPVRKLGGVGASKGKVRRAFTCFDFL